MDQWDRTLAIAKPIIDFAMSLGEGEPPTFYELHPYRDEPEVETDEQDEKAQQIFAAMQGIKRLPLEMRKAAMERLERGIRASD